MSILQSLILAVALAAGSFAGAGALTSDDQTQAGSTSGPINCESPCRINDPKCRCGGDGK